MERGGEGWVENQSASLCVADDTFNLIECLRYERLDGFKALHHETQSRKLTAAIGDQLIGQRLWKDLLQAERLESSKRGTCPKMRKVEQVETQYQFIGHKYLHVQQKFT